MKATAEDFRRHFALLSDESLLNTSREDLVDVAQSCYDEEISRRNLNATVSEPIPTGDNAPVVTEDPGDLVSIASFPQADEAGLARGLLSSAGIPSFLENEKAALGAVQLLVPAALVEEALAVLGPGALSDDELAAQAEAAALLDTDEQ